jgi:hypothetical protein
MKAEKYNQIQKYLEDKQIFCQIDLESASSAFLQKIEKFQVNEHTVPSTLLQELEPLQYQLEKLIKQLKSNS